MAHVVRTIGVGQDVPDMPAWLAEIGAGTGYNNGDTAEGVLHTSESTANRFALPQCPVTLGWVKLRGATVHNGNPAAAISLGSSHPSRSVIYGAGTVTNYPFIVEELLLRTEISSGIENTGYILRWQSVTGYKLIARRCIFTGRYDSSSGSPQAININSAGGAVHEVLNCLIYDYGNATTTNSEAIRVVDSNVAIYNCTINAIQGDAIAIYTAGTNVDVRNTVVTTVPGNKECFTHDGNAQYTGGDNNISSDFSGEQFFTNWWMSDSATEYVDAANADYNLKPAAVARAKGQPLGTLNEVHKSINGADRNIVWDIGAFQNSIDPTTGFMKRFRSVGGRKLSRFESYRF